MIFLIEKLWTDPMENELSAAAGYSVEGYVKTENEARCIVKEGGEYKYSCWAIINWPKPISALRYRKMGKYERKS